MSIFWILADMILQTKEGKGSKSKDEYPNKRLSCTQLNPQNPSFVLLQWNDKSTLA